MSSIVIQGDTSGSITVEAPAVAGTNTLTLPANTGNILTDGAALPAIDGSALTNLPAPAALSTASGSAPSYSARAWVNFNGTGTVAIRASGNVSSITDNGTGDYTVNFTNALEDANYCVTTIPLANDTLGTQGGCNVRGSSAGGATTMTTTAIRIHTGVTSSNLLVDRALVNIAVFR